MGDIIAEPILNGTAGEIASQIPQSMKLDPLFDWTVLMGIPFWLLIDIALTMLCGIVLLYWLFRMKRLRSVRGYVEVLKKATQFDEMVWIVNATRKLTIECMSMCDGVLKFPGGNNIIRWVHDERVPPLNIGGAGGILCSEGYYRSRDMVAEIARDIACDNYNANVESLDNSTGPITNYIDYERFGRPNLETIYPYGPSVPSFVQFDPERDAKYKPIGLTARLNGGFFKRDVARLRVGGNQAKWYEKFIIPGVILVIVVVALIASWQITF